MTRDERERLRRLVDEAQRRRYWRSRLGGHEPAQDGLPTVGVAEHVPQLRPRPTGDLLRQ